VFYDTPSFFTYTTTNKQVDATKEELEKAQWDNVTKHLENKEHLVKFESPLWGFLAVA
jgi:hypothetical protein